MKLTNSELRLRRARQIIYSLEDKYGQSVGARVSMVIVSCCERLAPTWAHESADRANKRSLNYMM